MARITEHEARAAYLAMGPDRSLAKLRRGLGGPGVAPSLTTFETWSKKFGWRALAQAHDERVSAKAMAKIETAQVADRVSMVQALEDFSATALLKARELIAGAKTIGHIEVLVDRAIDALKQQAVMTGGVSDRTMALNVAGHLPGETPQQARARRVREAEAEFGLDPPAVNGQDPSGAKPH